MTYNMWVRLAGVAGVGLDPHEKFLDKMDVFNAYLGDVIALCYMLQFMGCPSADVNEAVDLAGSRFAIDIGYPELAMDEVVEFSWEDE